MGPSEGPSNLVDEFVGTVAYLAADPQGQYPIYAARDLQDPQSHGIPVFSIGISSSARDECRHAVKVVLASLRLSSSPSNPPLDQPQAQPPEPTESFVIQPPGDGYDPSTASNSSSGLVPQVQAASAQDLFADAKNNCTWYVAGRRQDIINWIGASRRDAYIWADRARANGAPYGVYVSSTPQVGDIAVWPANCGGTSAGQCEAPAYQGCGHVAYVSSVSGSIIHIDEYNWGDPPLKHNDRDVNLSQLRDTATNSVACQLSFIHQPVQAAQPPAQAAPGASPNVIQKIWNWFTSFFGG